MKPLPLLLFLLLLISVCSGRHRFVDLQDQPRKFQPYSLKDSNSKHVDIFLKDYSMGDFSRAKETTYLKSLYISTSFLSDFFLSKCEVEGFTHFEEVNFYTQTIFSDVLFKGEVSLKDVAFMGPIYASGYRGVDFEEDLLLDYCAFYSPVGLQGAWFEKKTTIRNSFVGNVFDLSYAKLFGTLSLDSMIMSDSGLVSIVGTKLPDTINLANTVNLSIDLNSAYSDTLTHYLILHNADLNRIKFDYQNFKLLLLDRKHNPLNEDNCLALYESVLKHFKARGQMESYKLLDIEYKKYADKSWFKWKSRLSELWWNFGYDRSQVIWNSLLIMMVFFAINSWMYPRVLYDGYVIEELVAADQRITDKYANSRAGRIRKAFCCFIYTGYIFWGLKLSVDKIKLVNVGMAIWIIAQYAVGVTCLAFIANVVITR